MVIQVLHCRHCDGQNVIRHGKDKAGRQRYRCHDCRRTFQERAERHSPQFRARVLAAYQERASNHSSMRGVCRIFGIGRNTLSGWIKKTQPTAAAP